MRLGKLLDRLESRALKPIARLRSRRVGRSWYVLGDGYVVLRLKGGRVVVARRILSVDKEHVLYEDIYGNVKSVRMDMLEDGLA